ncbi:MAG: aromatic amino acid transport family protein [Spirochaetia bacterium]|jgi:amino acid permease|nr:aromatic amino acid transport family protein [Spirochaetia bacterium]
MNSKGSPRLSFFEATSIIAGYGIGGGILALPWLIARNGLLVSAIVIVAAYLASLLLHLYIGELAIGDGTGSQIVELYKKYLFTGKFGIVFTWAFFVVMGVVFLANLAAYVAGGNEALAQGLGIPSPWGAVVFYILAAAVAALGLKALGIAEKWAVGSMGALFVVLTIATVAARIRVGGPAKAWSIAIATRPDSANLPAALFGMAMFCFAAFFSVPQAAAGLSDRPKLLPRAVAAGLGVNALLILLVTIMSLIASDSMTQIATVGWSKTLGPWAQGAGTAFVLLAMLTSYWSISFALSTIVEERLKAPRLVAWAVSTLPTLFIALAGFGGFMDFMRTAGGGIAILIAALFLPAYYSYRRTVSAPATLPRILDRPWAGWVIGLAYALMAVGSIVSIG